MINGRQCTILKDDGCNTNIISTDFARRNKKYLNIIEHELEIEHSNENNTEKSPEIVVNATIQIGRHTYCSNWVISNCRYDVILGTPWHNDNNVVTNYEKQSITVNRRSIPVPKSLNSRPRVSSIGIKKFKSLIRKNAHKTDFQIFQIAQVNNSEIGRTSKAESLPAEIEKQKRDLAEKYAAVFRDDLPQGLPPERSVDHEINIVEGSKPPHRALFQLSPAELVATKNYVTEMLNKGKIRPSRSPFAAPLFLSNKKTVYVV